MPISSPDRKAANLQLWIVDNDDLDDPIWNQRKFTRRDLVLNIDTKELRKGRGVWADMQKVGSLGSRFLVWEGLLTQTGSGAPTVEVLDNTLGITPTIARSTAGNYTIASAGDFPEDLTAVYAGGSLALPVGSTASINAFWQDEGTVGVVTMNAATDVPEDDILFSTAILIKVKQT